MSKQILEPILLLVAAQLFASNASKNAPCSVYLRICRCPVSWTERVKRPVSTKPEEDIEVLPLIEEKADLQACSTHPGFIFQTTSHYNYTLAVLRRAQYRCSQPGSLL